MIDGAGSQLFTIEGEPTLCTDRCPYTGYDGYNSSIGSVDK